jgi:hypothetical protein
MVRRLRYRFANIFLAALVLLALPLAALADSDLRGFATQIGLTDADGFATAVAALRETGRLPDRYLTKRTAERGGWKPGIDLCRTAPDHAIGGDSFSNREKRLPAAQGRRWHEADLDYACGKRGAKRLLWSSDGLIFVTVDHYQTFTAVPAP